MDHLSNTLRDRAAEITALRSLIVAAEERGDGFTAEERAEIEKREAAIAFLDEKVEARRKLDRFEATLESREIETPLVEGVSAEQRGELYTRAFDAYLRHGAVDMDGELRSALKAGFVAQETRDMSKGTPAAGGYSVPQGFLNELQVFLFDAGHMHSLARVITTETGNDLPVPQVTAHGAAAWAAEAAALTATDETLNQITLKAYKAYRLAKLSIELLQDSAFDLPGYLAEEFGRAIGALANTAYVNGASGSTTTPKGVMNRASVGKTGLTGQTTSVIADDLVDLFHSVSPPYRRNAAWIANDQTIKAIRKLKTGVSGDNTFLWQPGLQAGQPDTLLGKPIYADPDVPVMAANAKSVAFGEFRGYYIRDVAGANLVRLNERYMDNMQVGFLGWIRTDGDLIDANAVKVYVNSAT